MKALVKKFRAYLHKLANDIRVDQSDFILNLKADWNKVPNLFTEARILCSSIPGLIRLNSNDTWWIWFATIFFVFIASTDRVDGYLARKLNQVTKLGEFLDPAGDKLLIIQTFIVLIVKSSLIWMKPFMIFIIVCEIIVAWLSFRAKHQKTAVAVTYFGKVKMTIQCIAIFIISIPDHFTVLSIPIHFTLLFYQITLFVTVAITAVSLIIYLFKFHVWRKSSKVYDRD